MEFELLRLGIELVVTAFAAILWWNFRSLAADVKVNQKEFTDFRLQVAVEYVRHKDMDRIEEKIDQIFSRLDSKADKDRS